MFSTAVIMSALELGCIYALVGLALFLSFRVLNIADMTTDGSFTLGCAVSATVAVAGHPLLALPAAMLAGADIRGDEVLEKHADWVEEFSGKYDKIDASNIDKIIEDEIGIVFMQVLEDAGVYKRTAEGKAAFKRFVESL